MVLWLAGMSKVQSVVDSCQKAYYNIQVPSVRVNRRALTNLRGGGKSWHCSWQPRRC